MRRIYLTHELKSGRETLDFPLDVTEIDLTDRGITSVDLAPLAKCTGLQSLVLSHNNLNEIELWPLMRCKNLERLSLKGNPLKRIDVTPLLDCPRLRTVEIDKDVEIVANYNMRSRLPAASLDQLRSERAVKWRFDQDTLDPLIEIERLKNKLFLELNRMYCSPDNCQVVHAQLMHRLCDSLEGSLLDEITLAEQSADYRRVYVLERGLEYIKNKSPLPSSR